MVNVTVRIIRPRVEVRGVTVADLAQLEARLVNELETVVEEVRSEWTAAKARAQQDVAALSDKVLRLERQVMEGATSAATLTALRELRAEMGTFDPVPDFPGPPPPDGSTPPTAPDQPTVEEV